MHENTDERPNRHPVFHASCATVMADCATRRSQTVSHPRRNSAGAGRGTSNRRKMQLHATPCNVLQPRTALFAMLHRPKESAGGGAPSASMPATLPGRTSRRGDSKPSKMQRHATPCNVLQPKTALFAMLHRPRICRRGSAVSQHACASARSDISTRRFQTVENPAARNTMQRFATKNRTFRDVASPQRICRRGSAVSHHACASARSVISTRRFQTVENAAARNTMQRFATKNRTFHDVASPQESAGRGGRQPACLQRCPVGHLDAAIPNRRKPSGTQHHATFCNQKPPFSRCCIAPRICRRGSAVSHHACASARSVISTRRFQTVEKCNGTQRNAT